uniref:Glutamyl-tRNA reductase n=1 Tax=Cyanoptyche gloeocystis TaxID=77922 RepID=A0A3G1IWC0_9EUKA|nr:glutamyl-tRNA reductase [Cyanoptyche gloeocystis]
MNIIVVGLSHKTAPVDLREKLSIPESKIGQTIKELCSYPNIEEATILSTCNRLEIYLLTQNSYESIRETIQFLADSCGLSFQKLRPHLFVLSHQEAVMHLMRVTAGLDSLILGEGQILSQVKQCYQTGQQHLGIGPILNHLFKQAISAGKRIRTETSISTGAVSISSAAVELAQIKKQNLEFLKITVVGAGKMSRLVIQHLLSKNINEITLINRSLDKAKLLCSQFKNINFKIYSFAELDEIIASSDLAFVGTSSQQPIITKKKLTNYQLSNPDLMFFDISVPRNVHPDVTELENVKLFNVDDLKAVVLYNQESRKKIAKQVEILLEQELIAFEVWCRSLEAIPTINKLREKAETIRVQELQKALSRLGNEFAQQQQDVVDTLTKGIVNKILHDPMVQLRAQQDIETRDRALKILQVLFNLNAMRNLMPKKIYTK